MESPQLVAGIGTSAGGLESLERFFRNIPLASGVAFVVVQHLSAEHKSLMQELLTRFTRIPVHDAVDGLQLEADRIYLLTPGTEVEVRGDRLAVFPRTGDHALAFPIDRMLASLADSQRARAAAVILSGSGSDGSRGVRRVEAAGGIVLVEDPTLAAFDGMPRAAIDTGAVHAVMSAESLAQALVEHIQTGALPEGEDTAAIESIVRLLRTQLNADFDEYKRGTIYRRSIRRARLVDHRDLRGYLERLERDPEELIALHDDLLIGVTSMFRNPSAFALLAAELDAIVASPIEPGRELRAWCAGCASGEEAYSLAILLDEAIRRAGSARTFKVFATDLSTTALETASTGIYTADRMTEVSAAQRQEYFVARADGTFQVSAALRHRVVIARHDLLKDTPFTNLDVVTCRNLLIYLKMPAQRRALSSLSYGLRVGGTIFLGSSESLGELSPHFETINENAKLYRKRVHSRGMHRPELPGRVGRVPLRTEARPEVRLLPLYDALLDTFMPPSFLVSEQRVLLDSYGGAARLLTLPSRRPTGDFFELVPAGARATLSALFMRAQRDPGTPVAAEVMWERPAEPLHRYGVTIRRLAIRNSEVAYAITLAETGPASAAAPVVAELDPERTLHLEQELTTTRMTLQTTIEELEAANEELQATNEELTASNEELQSVNEELHSVNEELHTVNAEHQLKITELTELNRDIVHLLDSIDVATVYLDRELKIRKYTPRAAAIFGLVEHDTGRYLASFNHQLHYPTLMDDVTAVRDGGPRVEKEVRSRDQRWYFVRLLAYRVAGRVEGVVVTLVDATTLAEAKARARQLSSIVESNADAIISMGLDGTIVSWNAGATRIYGYTSDEAIGRSIMILVPPAEQPTMLRSLEKIAAGEAHINIATTRLGKGGQPLSVAKTMSPVRDAAGMVVGIATIDRDIHQQIELERRLRESEQRYEDLYHHAPDSYLTIDVRGGRILEVNQTFQRVLGYPADQATGMHVLDLFTEDAQERGRRFLASVRTGQAIHDVPLEVVRKTGEPLAVALSASAVFAPDGTVIGARTVLRDASARREGELAVERAARMREQFLAMVSHELRGPLHAISAAFQIIDHPDTEPAGVARSHAVVRRQCKQLGRLVDDLLDVSRITHGKLSFERAPLDLAEVVRSVLDAVAPAYHGKGVVLSSDGLDVVLPMFGDAGRLAQVFGNLLNNALRCTPEGRRVWVSCAVEGDRCAVSVNDEGRGIEAEELTSIFDMFRQARQGLARTEGGLGLGLTIADRIVIAHGGTITARSEGLQRGASFTVELPLDRRAVAVEPARAEAPGTLSIVLVEDQDDPRELLVDLLRRAGHDAVAAADGASGLAFILERRPAVALLDIGLPVLNGYELAARVREELGPSIKLVALTGYGQPEDVHQAEAAGFDHHLTKPIDMPRLRALLRELARQRPE